MIPVRPEEIANRIRVELDASGALLFEVKGSKLRDRGSGVASHVEGIGQPMRWLSLSAVDPARQEVFDWLRGQVAAQGGTMTIGKGLLSGGLCSAFRAMSRRLFPRHRSPPSFYALRHAACAELKACGIEASEVAKGMGHASALSQKTYGMKSQGSGQYVIKADASSFIRIAPFSPLPTSAKHHVGIKNGCFRN